VAAAGERAKEAMRLRYQIIAMELRHLGIDSNCAPMVDVATPHTHDFLRNRCYGDDPDRVAVLGRAVADGLLAGGVIPVLKHIPGHGAATVDSHYDLPRVDDDLSVVQRRDFAPFRALNDLPMGMTAHLVYSALDDKPATLSSKVMQVIREDIGFENLIMTDDLGMKALSGTLADLSRQSLEAGCDVVLYCNGTLDQRREVAEAAGQLSFAGQTRALRALNLRKTPDDVDINALSAQLETLLSGQRHG
jgi:beta-N-acetylhexosaminidase